MRKLSFITWSVLVVMIVCNILLAVQNTKLREIIDNQEKERKPRIGEFFGDFQTVTADEKTVDFSNYGKKKIILFSNTSCPYCKIQNAYWTQLLNQINESDYDVYMLFNNEEDRAKVIEYLNEYGYENEGRRLNIIYADGKTLQKYKLNGTPTTLEISKDGKIAEVWSGFRNKSNLQEIANHFSISLNPSNK